MTYSETKQTTIKTICTTIRIVNLNAQLDRLFRVKQQDKHY